MSTLTFENNNLGSFILLPSFIADKFLKTASHCDLKVLIHLLRNTNVTLDEKEICRALDITDEQLKSSIEFWVKSSVLQKKVGRLSFAISGFGSDEMPAFSAETVSLRAQSDDGLRILLEEAQKLLSKLLSPSDITTLFKIYDWAGLPPSVILMLIEYCVSIGNTGMRYIEKCALNWVDDGILTTEMAEEKIRQLKERQSIEGKVAKLMGIENHARTKKQKEYIAKWAIEWKFTLDMISAAYENMVDRIGKLSFDYMDKILAAWHENGYKKVDDTKADIAPKSQKGKKKNSEKDSSYDIDDLFRPYWEVIE